MLDTMEKVLIVLLGVIVVISSVFVYQEKSKRANLDLAQREGYTFYLNGNEVDADTIDFKQYSNVSFDNEKNVVYMSR